MSAIAVVRAASSRGEQAVRLVRVLKRMERCGLPLTRGDFRDIYAGFNRKTFWRDMVTLERHFSVERGKKADGTTTWFLFGLPEDIPEPGPKKCWKCSDIKEPGEFWANRREPDGLDRICIECASRKNAEYYKKNKARINRRARQRYHARKKTKD